ncbi:hypothetical protein HDV04_000031 [Boothiomyces sp. JEL0838]|nr:hypothetical protein HDV04_000031 [Boothiomyces sp. JEL0838]
MSYPNTNDILGKLRELLADFQNQSATLELANLLLDTLLDLVISNAELLESPSALSMEAQRLIIQILECSKAVRGQTAVHIPMAHTPSKSSYTSHSEPLQQSLYQFREPININLYTPETPQKSNWNSKSRNSRFEIDGQVKSISPGDGSTLSDDDRNTSSKTNDESDEYSEDSVDEDYTPGKDGKGKGRTRFGDSTGASADICSPIDDVPNELTPLKKLIMYEWLKKNIDDPYLTQEKKFQFSYFLRLSITQIEDFFSNARRRILGKKKTPVARQRALAAKMRKIEPLLDDLQPDSKLMSVLLDGGVKLKRNEKFYLVQRQKQDEENDSKETCQIE